SARPRQGLGRRRLHASPEPPRSRRARAKSRHRALQAAEEPPRRLRTRLRAGRRANVTGLPAGRGPALGRVGDATHMPLLPSPGEIAFSGNVLPGAAVPRAQVTYAFRANKLSLCG